MPSAISRWFHRLGSPRWFYHTSRRWLPWLAILTIALLVTGVVWGLGFAPQDARQGNSYRIIFIHVPASVLALVGYYVMAGAGAIALIWRIKMAEMVMISAAPLGAALTFLALLTGAVWAKPTWGTYWVWDARTTSMLILLFLYLGVMALGKSYAAREVAYRACAIVSLVGTVNIPIIYKSVDWWYTLHQPATIKFTSAPSMHPSMLQPLLVTTLGFYCFYALVLMLNTRAEIIGRERRAVWVRELLQ
ncbi:MAG TPA: heme ABC transporter permease [Porticoccaceae bacterium]|nr:heme ABC transporter permease [Porticoccaceae bacterium]